MQMSPNEGLYYRQGGAGERLLVLLHGLGANGSVWTPMLPAIEKSWQGRWVAPDFRGHGRSPFVGPHGYGAHAADIAALVEQLEPGPVFVVGHSFGGVVGALLASGWFGPQVSKLFAFGVKLKWSDVEIAKAHELARKPARTFPTKAEAVERYLKGAGLFGLLSPDSDEAATGVVTVSDGYQVRMDAGVYGAVGPSIHAIFAQVRCPFRLAAGVADAMVTADDMREVDAKAVTIEGAGHSAHVEKPGEVWRQIFAAFGEGCL